ncbi:hypothetical protein H8B02_22940 [Bradyrhizobium sp. Pear77]|uniref:DUF6602 domain-containing protein n=1 Tax=Bradyrhizobium altum TaxID=1571202 RepID=UPI001E50702B|nr:DUF6602 domain-containing protein [Bradyrhizobium altum]MCC8956179.1 hypothetical protein [Bradyrhizobium altum]
MTKKNGTSGENTSQHISYLAALQQLADHSRRELAQLMPHYGERGRIAEEIIKGVLTRILPKRFSISTGVIFSADGQVSQQTDIVIYDNFYNSPLLSEFGSCVFPVETVYATVEVKSVLTKRELRKSMDAIMRLRSVGRKRHYVVPGLKIENDKVRSVSLKQIQTVPPRNYIVAFSEKGLGPKYEGFCTNLRACLDQDNSHVHGVCVLDRNWFAGRWAFRSPAQLFGREGHGLLDLYTHILKGQQNFSIHAMDMDAYLTEQEGG